MIPPSTTDLLDAVRTEGERLAAVSPRSLTDAVPTLEDWSVERVVRHVGRVHRWVTGLLAAPPDTDPAAVSRAAPALPHGAACLPAYAAALEEMCTAFERVDPDRAVASFAGLADVRFWARRQAHELTVHRTDAHDAIHAVGGPEPVAPDPAMATDGVAEWLEVFASAHTASRDGDGLTGTTFGFVVTDTEGPGGEPAHWLLRYDSEGVGSASTYGHGTPGGGAAAECDVVLEGPAATLLLAVWRRRPLTALRITGDSALAARLVDAVRV